MESLTLRSGAAKKNITPSGSLFLYGYPHVQRYSSAARPARFVARTPASW
jgi:hypothetical protein